MSDQKSLKDINKFIKGTLFFEVINAIKFNFYFLRQPSQFDNKTLFKKSLRFAVGAFSRDFIIDTFRIVAKENSILSKEGKRNILLANIQKGIHYQKLGNTLVALVKTQLEEKGTCVNIYHVESEKSNICINKYRGLKLRLKTTCFFLLILLKASLYARKDFKLLFYDCEGLYSQILKYIYNYNTLKQQLKTNQIEIVLMVNDNWIPESIIANCCNSLNIPCALYPHGALSELTLPFLSNTILFWNRHMFSAFEQYAPRGCRKHILGAIEMLNLVVEKTKEFKYDVLLISQLNGLCYNEHSRFIDVFKVWAEYLKYNPNFRICIKMHPYDNEYHLSILTNIFGADLSKIHIVKDPEVGIDSLISKSEMVSTVSSTAVQYAFFFKKPLLLYTYDQHLVNNFPIEREWTFTNNEELTTLIQKKEIIYSPLLNTNYDWLEKNIIQRRVGDFINMTFS